MPLHIVTGALGYSGQYIARRLLAQTGVDTKVRTLTNSLALTSVPATGQEASLRDQIEIHPYHFDQPKLLVESLRGADSLINTYWVRFNHRRFTFAQAVRNTLTLFAAAREAGVRRVVHVSITNPDERSTLEYFRGKAVLEKALSESGLSYAILRPAVLFGHNDILINNIAWMLRHPPLLPIYGVFGDGLYKLQPIHVDDLAAIAVDQVRHTDNVVINAIGPETFTYRGLVETLATILGTRRRIISVAPTLGYALGRVAGLFLRDVVVTRDEIRGLMENRLYVDTPPPSLAVTKLTEWATANRAWLGRKYASEMERRRTRSLSYRGVNDA